MAIVSMPQEHTNFAQWQDKHELNATVTLRCLDKIDTQLANGEITEDEHEAATNSFLNIYAEETGNIGFNFDFMGGKDANNEQDYDAQLAKLGFGDILEQDTNGDGLISRSEFIVFEVNDSVSQLTPEQKTQAATDAFILFDAINQLQDNGDDVLSMSDFKAFYRVLDEYNYDETQEMAVHNGIADGQIDYDSYDAYLADVTGTIPEETYNSIYEHMKKIYNPEETT